MLALKKPDPNVTFFLSFLFYMRSFFFQWFQKTQMEMESTSYTKYAYFSYLLTFTILFCVLYTYLLICP